MLAHLWPVIENIVLCCAELQTQRKRRKLLNGEGGESTTSTKHLDKQQQEEEEKDSRNDIESPEFELGGGDGKPVDTAENQGEGGQPTDCGHKGLSEVFECELTAAKEKFTQCQAGSGGGENVKLKPSFGHRAGFDAFMTGYSFASIAVSLCQASNSRWPGSRGERDQREGRLGELREMRNKLANRGKTFPLHIVKSHFTSTSQQHKTAQLNMREYFKKHLSNDCEK